MWVKGRKKGFGVGMVGEGMVRVRCGEGGCDEGMAGERESVVWV